MMWSGSIVIWECIASCIWIVFLYVMWECNTFLPSYSRANKRKKTGPIRKLMPTELDMKHAIYFRLIALRYLFQAFYAIYYVFKIYAFGDSCTEAKVIDVLLNTSFVVFIRHEQKDDFHVEMRKFANVLVP
eukprot:513496_1